MITWLIAIWSSPIGRKAILYGAVLLAALYAGRLWLNKHDSRIEQEARIKYSGEIGKVKEAEIKAKEKEIADRLKLIDREKRTLADISQKLVEDRAKLYSTLKTSLAAIEAAKGNDYANVVSVPADKLDDALRSISGELAAGK